MQLCSLQRKKTSSPLSQSEVQKTKRNIEKSLEPAEINFQVLNIRSNDKGELIIIVPSKLDQDNALEKLMEKEQIIGFTAKKAKDR